MKTIAFAYWTIILSSLILFLMIILACGNLHKLKSTNLNQLKTKQENILVSRESSLDSLYTATSIFKSDSSNHWLWFQSRHPFVFNSDRGLAAESGKLIIGGNRLLSKVVHQNSLQISSSNKDSTAYANLESVEKSVVKEMEKERKIGNYFWLWIFGGGLLLWGLFKK